MLSDKLHMELLDQGLEALVLSAYDQLPERNTISPKTTAGCEQFHFKELGIDTDLLYEREVEFGSKSLHYSYTDKLLCIVYYNEFIDRYTYFGFEADNIAEALKYYSKEF